MELPEALNEEFEKVRNLLTQKGLWHTFVGDNYDQWAMEVRNWLRSQDLWNFLVEEDPIDPKSFKDLTKFQKERRQVVVLSLIQENIDYSIFHYIAEAYTPKRAWDILKEVFSEKEESLEDFL